LGVAHVYVDGSVKNVDVSKPMLAGLFEAELCLPACAKSGVDESEFHF